MNKTNKTKQNKISPPKHNICSPQKQMYTRIYFYNQQHLQFHGEYLHQNVSTSKMRSEFFPSKKQFFPKKCCFLPPKNILIPDFFTIIKAQTIVNIATGSRYRLSRQLESGEKSNFISFLFSCLYLPFKGPSGPVACIISIFFFFFNTQYTFL